MQGGVAADAQRRVVVLPRGADGGAAAPPLASGRRTKAVADLDSGDLCARELGAGRSREGRAGRDREWREIVGDGHFSAWMEMRHARCSTK